MAYCAVPSSVTVRVPASTSNLGSGFDCIGVAVDRWLTVSGRLGGSSITIEREGTLDDLALSPEQDRLVAGFNAACDAAKVTMPAGFTLRARSDIPVGRGLGSSASALVAGGALANALLELGLSNDALADACSLVEGHPDNVAASVRGGAVLALRTPETTMAGGPRVPRGGLIVRPLVMHESLSLIFAIPSFAISTAQARSALPPMITHSTAREAIARSAALVCGLESGDHRLLRAALDDLLHVPYRRTLVAGYDAVTVAAMNGGALGATLSGAGSAVVAIAPREAASHVEKLMARAWRGSGGGDSVVTFQDDGHTRGYHFIEALSPTGGAYPAAADHTAVRPAPKGG
jgi:homoserine kinase